MMLPSPLLLSLRSWLLPIMVAVLGVCALVVAEQTGSAPTALLACLLLVTLVVTWWLPVLQTRTLRVQIRPLNQPATGDVLLLHCQFDNQRPLHGLHLQLPIHDLLVHTQPLANIQSHGSVVLRVPVPRSGRYGLDHIQVSSRWPFGLFERRRRIDIPPMGLQIFPRITTLRSMPMPTRSTSTHDVLTRHADDHLECYSTARHPSRQPGMARAGLHPQSPPPGLPGYARAPLPVYCVVLDCSDTVQGLNHHSLDFCRNIAASLCACAARGEAILHLFANDRFNSRLSIRPDHYPVPDFLPTLASIDGESGSTAAALAEQALRMYPHSTLISLRSTACTSTLSQQQRWLDIRIHNDSFSNPMEVYSEGFQTPPPAPHQRLLTLHANSNFARFLQNAGSY